jgi:NAD(P)-dependent dehydrogenase (short-subunit alcohol dehydrogenase family)
MWLSNFLTNVYTQGTAKAGLNYMTKNMALELNRSNIRINALAPGYFNTEMNDEFFASDAGKVYLARIPPKRLGELHELDGPFYLLVCLCLPVHAWA